MNNETKSFIIGEVMALRKAIILLASTLHADRLNLFCVELSDEICVETFKKRQKSDGSGRLKGNSLPYLR